MKINAQIKDLCQQIVENFHPQKVILFGSDAYGKPKADSEVDLLVVMPFEGRNSQKVVEIISKVKTKMPLDLLDIIGNKQNFLKIAESDIFNSGG